jgi:hypothetical protein
MVSVIIFRLGRVIDLVSHNSSLHCTENWDEHLSTRGIWICKSTFINPVEISVGNFENPHSYRWILFIHFAQPEVWYLVIARNEWDEFELVNEYGGRAVGLCRSCVRAIACHVTWRHYSSGFKTVRLPTCRFQKRCPSYCRTLSSVSMLY